MKLNKALAIHIQVKDFNSLGARTEEERLAHNEAVDIIRRAADKAIKRRNQNADETKGKGVPR